jgi:hypothetical protein
MVIRGQLDMVIRGQVIRGQVIRGLVIRGQLDMDGQYGCHSSRVYSIPYGVDRSDLRFCKKRSIPNHVITATPRWWIRRGAPGVAPSCRHTLHFPMFCLMLFRQFQYQSISVYGPKGVSTSPKS